MSREGTRERGTLVIGVGNPDCADDGVGPLVASKLADLPGIRVTFCRGDLLALLDEWARADAVVLIDAAAACSAPGEIRRVELSARELPPEPSIGSTHGFGLAATIALGRALGKLPSRILLYAIEGSRFEPGAPMSASVAAAAERAARLIVEELRHYAQVPIWDRSRSINF